MWVFSSRRISPTSSPQSSPRPSPRQVHKSFPKNQRESIPSSPYYEKPDPLFDLVRLDVSIIIIKVFITLIYIYIAFFLNWYKSNFEKKLVSF